MMGRADALASLSCGPSKAGGSVDGVGIIPRAVSELFAAVAVAKESLEFSFKCVYVEIYCERVRDLLDPVPGQDLQVRQDPQEGVVVQGATEGERPLFVAWAHWARSLICARCPTKSM